MINVAFWICRLAILTHHPWFYWAEKADNPELYSDMLVLDGEGNFMPEPPFAAVRAGNNRIERMIKMLQMGFISPNEARALLGFS